MWWDEKIGVLIDLKISGFSEQKNQFGKIKGWTTQDFFSEIPGKMWSN